MVSYVPCMPAWSACPCTNVPNACQLLIFMCQCANMPINEPTGQRCVNYSSWGVNMPKGSQSFNIASQFFNYFSEEFFNFLIFQLCSTIQKLISNNSNFKNIWAILETLTCEAKNSHFAIQQNFIKEKPCQPKTFDIVFSGAHGINQTIIWLL